jgi:hypothetical protein
MFAWILILGFWIALLSLILHDATKDDDDGGAIRIAARKSRAALKSLIAMGSSFVERAVLKARRPPEAPSQTISQTNMSEPPVNVEIAAGTSPSSPEPIAEGSSPAIEKPPAMAPSKKKWRLKDDRVSMTTPKLELAIAEEVKKVAPGCEDFIGVVVRQTAPRSRLDPNWEVRGIKFGKADRKMANEALAGIVERMQQEFRLADD